MLHAACVIDITNRQLSHSTWTLNDCQRTFVNEINHLLTCNVCRSFFSKTRSVFIFVFALMLGAAKIKSTHIRRLLLFDGFVRSHVLHYVIQYIPAASLCKLKSCHVFEVFSLSAKLWLPKKKVQFSQLPSLFSHQGHWLRFQLNNYCGISNAVIGLPYTLYMYKWT